MRAYTNYILLLVFFAIFNAFTQVMMRWGGQISAGVPLSFSNLRQWTWNSKWWLAGLFFSWVTGLGWAWCLRNVPLAIALPIYIGLVYSLSVLGGIFLLHEKPNTLQVIGILIILVGLALL